MAISVPHPRRGGHPDHRPQPDGRAGAKGNKGEYGHELYEYYRIVVADRVCRMCAGTLTFAGGARRKFESIDCPLADDNGKVTSIIGVMDFVV